MAALRARNQTLDRAESQTAAGQRTTLAVDRRRLVDASQVLEAPEADRAQRWKSETNETTRSKRELKGETIDDALE
jgi:hypothetical protein